MWHFFQVPMSVKLDRFPSTTCVCCSLVIDCTGCTNIGLAASMSVEATSPLVTGGMWVCCEIRGKGCHMIYCVVSVCTQCVYSAVGAHNSISSHVYNESVAIPNGGIVSS